MNYYTIQNIEQDTILLKELMSQLQELVNNDNNNITHLQDNIQEIQELVIDSEDLLEDTNDIHNQTTQYTNKLKIISVIGSFALTCMISSNPLILGGVLIGTSITTYYL